MMTFPENVGYPIGQESYYMLEIHFDNPEELTGIPARSGVAVYYTNETR